MGKNVTASDIARVTGFSQSTVSRALSNKQVVASRTRDIIAKAAEDMGYQPNVVARSLITGRSRMIGLITADIKNPFYPEVIEKFVSSLRGKGFYVLFVNATTSEIQEEDIRPLLEYKVEGVIVTAAQLTSSIVAWLRKYGISTVLFNRYTEEYECGAICCDNLYGGESVADFLIRSGHRRLAFIAGESDTSTSKDRQLGFENRIRREGLPPPVLEQGHYSYDGAYEAALRLFRRGDSLDAIFCANDIMALGAIDAARSMNMKIPDDISVVGFDDIAAAAWPSYSLTTVRQPVDEMVDATVHRLVRQMEGDDGTAVAVFLRGTLVVRNSVRNRLTP